MSGHTEARKRETRQHVATSTSHLKLSSASRQPPEHAPKKCLEPRSLPASSATSAPAWSAPSSKHPVYGPSPSPIPAHQPTRLTLRKQERANIEQRFRDEGCPNCDDFLHLMGSQDQIEACTSQVFEGVITLSQPNRSWVAKWQRLDGYVPGLYAIKVSGQLPDEIRQVIEDEYSIHYIPYVSATLSGNRQSGLSTDGVCYSRDGSATEADA